MNYGKALLMRINKNAKFLILHKPKNRVYSEKSIRFWSHFWYYFILTKFFNISGSVSSDLTCYKTFLKFIRVLE